MKLIILLNLLLGVGVVWSWSQLNHSRVESLDARERLIKCTREVEKIESCSQRLSRIGIASANYDCTKDVARLIKQFNIASNRSLASGPPKTVQDNFAIKTIANPIGESVTLKQLVGFLHAASNFEIEFFINSMDLESPGKSPTDDKIESWDVVDIDLNYFSQVEPQ